MYKRGNRPEFDAVLDKMCEYVGADNVDFSDRYYRAKYKWATCDKDAFVYWLEGYLNRSEDLREQLMEYPSKSDSEIHRAAAGFVSHYGWREIL